nr:hypothetical protein [Tanacetum cinerariifolium]
MVVKKILIEKIEGNKSIHRSDEQRNLYKALVEACKSDKIILDTYGDTVTLKRCRDNDADKDEGKEPESTSAPKEKATRTTSAADDQPIAEASQHPEWFQKQKKPPTHDHDWNKTLSATHESIQPRISELAKQVDPRSSFNELMAAPMEEPSHLVFKTGVKYQPIVQTSQHPEWFSQPRRPPSPDRDWNKTLPTAQGNAQSWINVLARQSDARSSFNELLDTPIDFSNFIMNRLGVATLTTKLLASPTYELMRGSCNSLTELEYHLEEVYKATTDQLDWVNPK